MGPGEIAVAKHDNKLVFKHDEILEAVADSWSTVFKAKRIPVFANVSQQRDIFKDAREALALVPHVSKDFTDQEFED